MSNSTDQRRRSKLCTEIATDNTDTQLAYITRENLIEIKNIKY